jgi:pimeloyl-ACP methyl ester carboxylesterase
MTKTTNETLQAMQKHMKPLNMNDLQGRLLYMPAKKSSKREIMMVYGHHASLERMYGIAAALNDFGAVTMPDLPGFGGMDSFYKIGVKPTLDTMADYLASFVKLRYKRKRVTIAAMSLGFVIVTRMLQRYPELVSKVELLLSLVGFSHKYDYAFSRQRYLFYRHTPRLFTRRLPAAFFYNIILHPTVIRAAYSKTHNAKKKLGHLSVVDKKAALDFEVDLWRNNDVRTYMEMTIEMMLLDNCNKQVNLPVHHISVDGDQYFDSVVVEQHMRVIFTDFIEHHAKLPNHAPSILATKKEAAPLIPKSIKKVLRKTASIA